MADYEVTDPSGKTYIVTGPAGASKEQVIDVLQQKLAIQEQQYQENMSKTGLLPGLKSGARQFLAGTEEALGFKEAGAEQRKKAEEAYHEITPEDIQQAKEHGVLDTVGAYKSKYLTGPLGTIAGRYGAPVAASLAAPLVAPEALTGLIGGAAVRGLAGTAVDIGAEKSENIQSQVAAGQTPNQTKAWMAALPQAVLAGFGFPGTSEISKVLGPRLAAEAEAIAPKVLAGDITLADAKAELTNKTSAYLQNMGVNTVTGSGLMIGTEDIRRAQAGQSLMSGQEMLDSVIQAGLLSPVFGLLHPSERPKAEAILKEASGKYQKIQNELADLRTLAADRELTRQENINKARLEEEAKQLAIDMERRIPLTKQDTLPFETTADEVKAEQLKGQKQKDLFTEAATTEEPLPSEKITTKTLTDLDIGRSAKLHNEITGLDVYEPEQNRIIRDKLQEYLNKYGVEQPKIDKIENYIKQLESIGGKNVPATKVEPAGDRARIPSVDVGQLEDTTGIKTSDTGGVDSTGNDARQYSEGDGQQSLALTEEKQAPASTEVIKSEAELAPEEKPPVEEAPPEEQAPPEEPIPLEQEANKVANELTALDRTHPLIETLRDPLSVTEKDVQQARAEVETLKAQREGKQPTTLAEEKATAAIEADPIVDESRVPGSKPTGQTKESIMYRLKGIFGSGIDSLTKRGVLNVVNSVAELPKHIQAKIGEDAIGAHSEGVAHIIADRLAPENIRKVVLHEIGEHYGLEALVGERNYKDILQSVMAGKDKDAIIKAAWEHVSKVYPELKIGERQFLREIVAKIGEDAPSHPLWRRIINAVRNFLKVNKYKNMSGEDIQDIVMQSFKTAMKRDLKLEPIDRTENFKKWFGKSKAVDEEGVPLRLYHGTTSDFNIFKSTTETGAPRGGIMTTEGHYFTREPWTAAGYADRMGRDASGKLTNRPKAMGQKIIPVFLRMEKPLYLGPNEGLGVLTKERIQELKSKGYDGVIKSFRDGSGKEYVVFDANQIKSATGNKGTFDLSRPEIEFAKKEYEPNPEFKALYERAGGVYDKVEEPTLFQSLKDDPVNFVKEQAKVAPKFLDKFETMFFSSDASLQNAIRKGMESMGMSFDKMKEVLFRASTAQALHREAIAHQVLEKGGLQYDPRTYKYVAIDKRGSWKGVVEALKAAADENGISYEEMEKYAHQALIAKRLRGLKETMTEAEKRYVTELAAAKTPAQRAAAESKFENSRKVIHLSEAQIQSGEQLFRKVKGMQKVVDEWNLARDNIMDFAVDSGLYTQSEAQALLDVMDYVPFYRVEQLENRAGPKEFTRGLLDVASDKRFMGSKQPVNNVFDNMERWISYVVRKGIGNQSAKDLNEAAMKYLPEGEVKKLSPGEKVPHGQQGNVIGIWDNGSVDRYVYADPLFVHAFTGMEPIVIPALKGAAKFTNILRQNIVLNPLFSLGQLSQDAFGAMFVSGVKHPFALPLQVIKEFIGTLRGTSEAQAELKQYGAVGVRDYSSAVSRIDAEIAAGLKEPKLIDKIAKPFRALSMASDNAVRQAIYNQTLKETGNKALAIERAFEVINFRRAGASSTVNFLRQTVPFFGAYLQAMNVAAKTIAGKGIAPIEKAEARKILASTFVKVMIAGFVYNALISEDEDYKKLDPSIRDKKLLIPGTGGLSLPVRNDIFTFAAKILPEHIYQMTMAQATEDGTKAKKALSAALTNALLGPNVLPQFGKPIIEVMTNHNFFTDRAIVGQGVEELAPEKQYSVNTSELSKVLGSASGTSPMKWDHLLKSYFGYTAGLGLMLTDHVMSAGSNKSLPDKSFQDMIAAIPGMSAFVSKEFGTREKSDFYELRDLVNEAVKTSNYMKTYSTPEERKSYKEENEKLLQVKSQVNNINRQLTSIRKEERLTYEAPDSRMSPIQKQAKIKELRLREERVLKNIRELRVKAGL